MFSSELLSHPEKLLQDHLKNVAENCTKQFRDYPINLQAFGSREVLEAVVYIMGFVHDFGKATEYFQEYLLIEDKKRKLELKNNPLTSHSLISAVFCHIVVSKFLKDQSNPFLKQLPFQLFFIIKKHHGNIGNLLPSDDDNGELESDFEHLDKQLKAIDIEKLVTLFEILEKNIGFSFELSDLPASFNSYFEKNIKSSDKRSFKIFLKNCSIEHYLIFQYLYSILLFSDKKEVIIKKDTCCNVIKLSNSVIDNYKNNDLKGNIKEKINLTREKIFREAKTSIENLDLNKHILSLNIPTGSGKTLTSLSSALILRERLEKKGFDTRIIYGLPFTSIIDQNFEVYQKVFNNPTSEVLLKHHHLSEIAYSYRKAKNLEDLDEFEPEEAKFLIENWESQIIVTTFFQIFHTIFSNRNRMIEKFHKFANSIVLLDEIQAVPYKYWDLLRLTMLKMAEIFNTYFILITATQPKIFEENEIHEIIPNKKAYFKEFNRVSLTVEKEAVEFSDFIDQSLQAVCSSEESFLFVMNTIDSSIKLYNKLQKSGVEAEFFYLSTNIIPIHRLERIKEIKKSEKRKIIVSTQIIEAGVDIDIENVWRDFAPLESINQVCGRCNRNSVKNLGKVIIFEVLKEDGKKTPFFKPIYQSNILAISETRNIFKELKEQPLSEKDFLNYMNSYYLKLKAKKAMEVSEKILNYMKNFQFEAIFRNFKLIDDDFYKKEVFIEIDEKAGEVWRKYIDLEKIKNRFERKAHFLNFKKNFYDYIISIPGNLAGQINEVKGILYISKEELPHNYDFNTGFIRSGEGFENYVF